MEVLVFKVLLRMLVGFIYQELVRTETQVRQTVLAEVAVRPGLRQLRGVVEGARSQGSG